MGSVSQEFSRRNSLMRLTSEIGWGYSHLKYSSDAVKVQNLLPRWLTHIDRKLTPVMAWDLHFYSLGFFARLLDSLYIIVQ